MVEIHFQEGFEHADVRVVVGDSVVFSKTLTTEAQLGLAGVYELDVRHVKNCRLVVDDKQLAYSFKPGCPFLGVTFASETGIMVECSAARFLYD
ncbi:MAG: hypothetical protein H6585_09390 [Flavobacteriales bacterium]|nr:hypothetical protein [Flavobacteriales bacterium]